MSDSLRDRIAAALIAHRQDPYEQDMGECPCGFKSDVWDDQERHLADAVIAVLDLRVMHTYPSADTRRKYFVLAGFFTEADDE